MIRLIFIVKSFTLPADYKGKRVILRFDGVYSHAILSVNGKQVREHHGGFTRWGDGCDGICTAGKKNEIQLEITDRIDDISYASGYAHHPIGGILRDVTVFALPETCFYDFAAETHLDSLYRDAVLKVSYTGRTAEMPKWSIARPTPQVANYPLSQSIFVLKEDGNSNELPVRNPLKWDAEHPNLYTLTVTLREARQGNQPLQSANWFP